MTFGSAPPSTPVLSEFIPDSIRGMAGFFRVGRARSGAWWLIDPHGRRFFARAVNGVHPAGRVKSSRDDLAPAYEETTRFQLAAVHQLRSWNFNTLGIRSLQPQDSGMYFTEILDLIEAGPSFRLGAARLPDVFDPEWYAAIERRVEERCLPLVGERHLLGFYTDEGLGWAQGVGAAGGRPTLLQLCLSLSPTHRTYHAAWEYVLAPRRGEIERLGVDWGLVLNHREAVRQMTLLERAIDHPAYLQDNYEFSREFARRYHALAARAIRRADPNHLILGSRWATPPGPAVLAESVYPHVDLVSANLFAEDNPFAVLEEVRQAQQPVLFCDAGAGRPALLSPELDETSVPFIPPAVELLPQVLTHPSVVGYEWVLWKARHGNEVDAPGALVPLDPAETPHAHTALLTVVNGRVEAQRAEPESPLPYTLRG